MKTPKKLRLYVWEGVLSSYTDGIMVALATSPKHAREILKKRCSYLPDAELSVAPRLVSRAEGFVIWGGD